MVWNMAYLLVFYNSSCLPMAIGMLYTRQKPALSHQLFKVTVEAQLTNTRCLNKLSNSGGYRSPLDRDFSIVIVVATSLDDCFISTRCLNDPCESGMVYQKASPRRLQISTSKPSPRSRHFESCNGCYFYVKILLKILLDLIMKKS
ncbi:hypothetical protein Btru_073563 [Bulinus truncatus]|nr:hypothetical protein Btru_073563 [Bulinus truncatus]